MPKNPSGTDKENRNKRVVVREIMIGPASLQIFSGATGASDTRAAVRALVGDTPPIGSMFIGHGSVGTTKPNLYVRVAGSNNDSDWERVLTQASD